MGGVKGRVVVSLAVMDLANPDVTVFSPCLRPRTRHHRTPEMRHASLLGIVLANVTRPSLCQ
jgi:hypothetical protein